MLAEVRGLLSGCVLFLKRGEKQSTHTSERGWPVCNTDITEPWGDAAQPQPPTNKCLLIYSTTNSRHAENIPNPLSIQRLALNLTLFDSS